MSYFNKKADSKSEVKLHQRVDNGKREAQAQEREGNGGATVMSTA